VGKTQLAVATALSVRDEFPGGVFFASLADVTNAAGALYALAAAVEVRETNEESLTDTICRSLSTAPALLVLDNGEQVAGLGGLVAEILSGTEQLAVLATSRSPLHLHAEQRVVVPPLEMPPDGDDSSVTVDAALKYPAIELFTQRARAVDAYFELTPASLAAVLEICRRLDGSPLSLELAAARADILDVSEIEQRLSAQLTLLASEQADLPPRQRTARATVEWSISLLGADARELLFRLCQLVGPFTLNDVAALNSGDDGTAKLAELVDSSLVQASRSPTARLFRIAETVREYSRTALTSADLTAIRQQLLDHLASVVGRWSPTLHTPDAGEGVGEIRRRYEDIRGSITWALDEGRTGGVALLLADLRPYWVYDGQLREPREWLSRWLDLADSSSAVRPRVELAAGVLSYLLDEPGSADQLLRASVGDGQSDTSALAYGYLGAVRLGEGDLEAAAELAASCERALGDADYEAQSLALSLRAVISAVAGDTKTEREHYLRRLDAARRQGDRRRVAETLNNLAEVCLAEGDLTSAAAFAHEALSSARDSGRIVTRDALYTHARLDLMRENAPAAIVHAREALHISLDLGQRFEISQSISLLGAIAVSMGRVRDGAELMSAGQHMRSESSAPLDVDLEPELEHYRQQAARELGLDAYEATVSRAAPPPLDALVHLATGILPTR
jgi:predicted ATPase